MIKKLVLKSFGKFKGDAFEMKPVTIFVGRNEAGKTTLFDAMFDQLCSPKATTTEGKWLRDRYGEKRDGSLEFDSETWSFETDEFINIYAVRAGVADIGFKKNANWAEAIRNDIFSGGIDPAKIMKELKDQASDKATFSHVRNLRSAEKALAEAESRKRNLLTEREGLLSQETRVREGGQTLQETETQIKEKQLALSERRQQLQVQEKIRERGAIKAMLSHLLVQKDLQEKMPALATYAVDDTPALHALRGEIGQMQQIAAELKGQIAALEQQIHQRDAELGKSEQEAGQQKQHAAVAERLRIELNSGRAVRKEVVTPYFHKLLLGASVLLFTLAIAGFVGMLNPGSSIPPWIPGVALLAVAGILLRLSYRKKTEIVYDTQSDQRLLELMRDKWRNACALSLQAATIDGAAEELQRYVNQHEQTVKRILELKAGTRNIESDLNDRKKKAEKLKAEQDAAEKAIRDWFSSHGVTDLPEYERKRRDYESTQADLKKISETIEQQMRAAAEKNADTFRATLAAKLDILEKDITMEELPAEKQQRLKNEVVVLESDLAKLSESQRQQSEIVNKGIGGLQVRMGTLPAEIYACQKDIDELNKKIGQIQVDMKAAEYALQIFENIRHEQSDIFENLSAEISIYYSQMFPQERKIDINAFDAKEIEVEDIGGERRAIEHVSTATKDAFYLASRLAFALKTRGKEPGLIILDEPFASFDRERQEHATRFLKSFWEKNRWQIVVFTKDEGMAKIAGESFGGADDFIIHELAS